MTYYTEFPTGSFNASSDKEAYEKCKAAVLYKKDVFTKKGKSIILKHDLQDKYLYFGDEIQFPIRKRYEDENLYTCILEIDNKFPNPQSFREIVLNSSLYKIVIREKDSNISFARVYLSDVLKEIEKYNSKKIQKWDWEDDCLIW